jgi:outer membrane immunogenic protein
LKRILIIIALAAAIGWVFAQNPLAVGQKQINAGVGFSNWNVPVYVGMDFGVHSDVSVGGELSYHAYREHYENHHYNHSILGIIGNCNYHFNRVLKVPRDWDVYAGLNLGLYIWTSPDNYPGDHETGVGLGIQVGGRYYFSDKVGFNLEFGGGRNLSGGKVGVSVKL